MNKLVRYRLITEVLSLKRLDESFDGYSLLNKCLFTGAGLSFVSFLGAAWVVSVVLFLPVTPGRI